MADTSSNNIQELLEKKKHVLEELKIQEEILAAENAIRAMKSGKNRARAVTVGTAFGGVTEISMRGDGPDTYLWCTLQPVEVTELIHQLAGNIGCHIYIQPRKDFASWREWKEPSEQQLLHLNGWPPHPNDLAVDHNVGAALPPPEQQSGLNFTNNTKDTNEPLAAKKIING